MEKIKINPAITELLNSSNYSEEDRVFITGILSYKKQDGKLGPSTLAQDRIMGDIDRMFSNISEERNYGSN